MPRNTVRAGRSGVIAKSAIGPVMPATNAAKRITHRYRSLLLFGTDAPHYGRQWSQGLFVRFARRF
jgi:hypothetical protein